MDTNEDWKKDWVPCDFIFGPPGGNLIPYETTVIPVDNKDIVVGEWADYCDCCRLKDIEDKSVRST